MIKPTKRATIYLDEKLHALLKLKAIETSRSMSDLVNEAVRHDFLEFQVDLAAFEERASEGTISYEKMKIELKTV